MLFDLDRIVTNKDQSQETTLGESLNDLGLRNDSAGNIGSIASINRCGGKTPRVTIRLVWCQSC